MTPAQEALIEAARSESARIYGALCREARPAPPHVLDELLDALAPDAPPARRLVPVTRVEQCIARGHTDGQIARRLHVPVDVVADVRAAMDRAAS